MGRITGNLSLLPPDPPRVDKSSWVEDYHHFSAHFVSIFREFLFRVKSPILHCNWVSSGIEFAGRIGSVFRLN